MAKVSAVVVPSRKNKDNSIPIRIKITNADSTSYISTPYKIDNMNEWGSEYVCRRKDSDEINKWLDVTLNRYKAIIEALPAKSMSASEIKEAIEQVVNYNAINVDFVKGLKEAVNQLQQELNRLNDKVGTLMSYLDLIG